jgi:hypothetical protein
LAEELAATIKGLARLGLSKQQLAIQQQLSQNGTRLRGIKQKRVQESTRLLHPPIKTSTIEEAIVFRISLLAG